MGLDEVKQEILSNARKEADVILASARLEAQEIDNNVQAEIQEYRNTVGQDTEKLVTAMIRRETASVEFDLKKARLDKKKEMIESVFENSKKKMQNLNANDKEKIFQKLVAKANKEIDVKVVYANEADKAIVSKIKGVTYKESDISGGVIAETEDGRMRIDYSYNEIFDAIKKDNLQQIALLLFGK